MERDLLRLNSEEVAQMTNLGFRNAVKRLENAGLLEESMTLRELRDQLGPSEPYDPAGGYAVAWDKYVVVVARPGQLSDDPIEQVIGEDITLDTKVGIFLDKLKNADLSNQSGAFVLGTDSVNIIR